MLNIIIFSIINNTSFIEIQVGYGKSNCPVKRFDIRLLIFFFLGKVINIHINHGAIIINQKIKRIKVFSAGICVDVKMPYNLK